MSKEIIESIILHLQPHFAEYADDSKAMHWMDYSCELDEIGFVLSSSGVDELVSYLNERMKRFTSNAAEHEACLDVASCVESLLPSEFKGKFVYS